MNTWIRLLCALVTLTGGLAGMNLACPEWVSPPRLDGNAASEFGPHEQEQEHNHGLPTWDRRQEVLGRRLVAKTEVVNRLIAEELTLFEAAAWFRFLNENPTDCQATYRDSWPGTSDGEKLCQQVIQWDRAHLQCNVSLSRAAEETRRLESDLADHIARNGTVVLPDL